MTDTTISISSKPRIKCFPRNSEQAKLEKIAGLMGEEILWTGESVYCICSHHVKQHCTVYDQYDHEITIHCHGSNERCNCEGFKTRGIRLIHSNCYKMVTEGHMLDTMCNLVPEIYPTQTKR
jgi:hypothetical protein